MNASLKMTFEVACPPEHAFHVWTSRIGTWWPPDHTVSGPDVVGIVMQSGVGGRIFERTSEGVEHDWGEVTIWNPPEQLSYLWHLGRDRADATEVDIRFVARSAGSTRIEIEHSGWERLGSEGHQWRQRNRAGWESLLPHYRSAIAQGES